MIVFGTPGEIDIKSFTIFGINAKPNTATPIGYFGTGLKYAIAVLVRNGIKPTLWIGQTRYDFYVKETDFRGKDVFTIMMKKHSWQGRFTYHTMPYTTELGKNWELWQAFRELYSNTLDEGGQIQRYPSDELRGLPGSTYLTVNDPRIDQIYWEKDKIFLPEGRRVRESDEEVQVLEGESHHIYYRSLRVHDLPKDMKTLFTYNILTHLELTEDRTAKYEFAVSSIIAAHVSKSHDIELIRKVISAREGYFEHKMNWWNHNEPSKEFSAIMTAANSSLHSLERYPRLTSGVRDYWSKWAPPAPDSDPVEELITAIEQANINVIWRICTEHKEEVLTQLRLKQTEHLDVPEVILEPRYPELDKQQDLSDDTPPLQTGDYP